MSEVPKQETTPSPDAGEQLKSYLRILVKRKWNVLAAMMLAIGSLVFFQSRQVPIFRAVSKVLIADSPPRVLSGVKEVIELGTGGYWTRKEYFKTQCEIIGGAEVAERVVESLKLRQNDTFMGRKAARTDNDAFDPVHALMNKVEVVPLKDSWVVNIEVEDANPKFAQELADAFAREYTQYNLDTKKRIVLDAQRDLFKMVSQLSEHKRKTEEELYAFERDHNIGTFDNQKKALDQRLDTLRNRLNEVGLKKSELQAKLQQMRRFLTVDDPFEVAYADVLNSPLVMDLKRQLIEKRNILSELEATYLEKHPKLVAVQNQLRQITSNLRKEIRSLITAAEGQYRETADLHQDIQSQIEAAKQQENELNQIRLNYEPLKQRLEEANKFFEQVKARQTETQLSAQSETNNVRVYEVATEPRQPVRPNVKLNTALAVVFGLVSGIALALLREFLDNTVKKSEDIEQTCGLTYLGTVPHMRDSRRASQDKDSLEIKHPDLFLHYRPRSNAAENVRTIRTNLMFTTPERPLHTMMVTSPNPREGKTAVSISLAIAMAQSGARVLLVDTDLRRPRLHRALGLPSDFGITNYLIGDGRVSDLVLSTEVPGLSLLPRGPEPPNPAELLHTKRFQQLLAELAAAFDVVMFDTPPVLPVSDAQVIAAQVDGVVLVAKHDVTSRESLLQARKELQRTNARVLGAILNDLDLDRRGYGYSSYYRKRYQYDYHDKRADDKPLV